MAIKNTEHAKNVLTSATGELSPRTGRGATTHQTFPWKLGTDFWRRAVRG